MPEIQFDGRSYTLETGESVLSALRRGGVEVPSSCENGICQTCMLKAVSGTVPDRAVRGLRAAHREQGYFLSCVCEPEESLEIARIGEALTTRARIAGTERLNDSVLRVALEPESAIDYRAGQFVNFIRDDVVRSYSIASVPGLDNDLEFHVALMPNGRMSGWLHEDARPGDAIDIAGPLGTCYYAAEDSAQPLFLLGTGTGLAPLYGIARDALHRGHTGEIHLFHGSLSEAGLYYQRALHELAAAYPQFHYHPCALNGPAENGVTVGSIDELAMDVLPDLKGWRVYLCGHPDMVKLMQRKTFLAGARMNEIHADAFLPSAT